MRGKPILALKSQVEEHIERFYQAEDNIYNRIKTIKRDTDISITEHPDFKKQLVNVESYKKDTSPMVKLLNFRLSDAIKDKAADINIERKKIPLP